MSKYIEGLDMNHFKQLPEFSVYNHNYHKGFDSDLLFAQSDDDNTTEWYLVKGSYVDYLGYSFASENEILHHGLNT